jgi:GNAT superfamily N-acetyltransferase
MTIRSFKKEDYDACVTIANNLTEWFDKNELADIAQNVTKIPTFVVDDNGVQAYICVELKSTQVIELKHFAVIKERQNRGLGTELLSFIEKQYPNAKIIEVKTLDESRAYEPYARTRAFYEKNGFIKIDVIDPYPGWEPNSPCAIYIKCLK